MTKYNDADVKKASEAISEHVAAAYAAIQEAEKLADEFGLEFSFDLTYGMGGTYIGKNYSERAGHDWYSSNEGSWLASSQSC